MVTRGQRGGRDQQGRPGDFAVMDTRPSTLIHTQEQARDKENASPGTEPVWGAGARNGVRTRSPLYTELRDSQLCPATRLPPPRGCPFAALALLWCPLCTGLAFSLALDLCDCPVTGWPFPPNTLWVL